MLCLLFLAYFRYFKSTWSVQSKKDKYRNAFFCTLFVISFVVLIFSIIGWTTPFISDLLRPFVIVNFLGSLRSQLKEFGKDLCASSTILVTIFGWIVIYSIIGFYFFRFSFEGRTSFLSFWESYKSMQILLTTANFPDIMLPSYHRNYYNMLFFTSYLCFGLYLLLSLLLASVFNKFKQRLSERLKKNENKRREQVLKVYKMFESPNRDYLYPDQFKELIQFVFDINLNTKVGRRFYRRILVKLCKSERDDFPESLIVNFLVDRGAFEKRKAANEIELLDESGRNSKNDDEATSQ